MSSILNNLRLPFLTNSVKSFFDVFANKNCFTTNGACAPVKVKRSIESFNESNKVVYKNTIKTCLNYFNRLEVIKHNDVIYTLEEVCQRKTVKWLVYRLDPSVKGKDHNPILIIPVVEQRLNRLVNRLHREELTKLKGETFNDFVAYGDNPKTLTEMFAIQDNNRFIRYMNEWLYVEYPNHLCLNVWDEESATGQKVKRMLILKPEDEETGLQTTPYDYTNKEYETWDLGERNFTPSNEKLEEMAKELLEFCEFKPNDKAVSIMKSKLAGIMNFDNSLVADDLLAGEKEVILYKFPYLS